MKILQTNKLWGAAFSQKPSDAVLAFTAGRDVVSPAPADEKLLPYDIWVNKAHCVMLAKQGIIPNADAVKILKALQDKFTLDPALEDVHTNIESQLTEKLGIEVAGKLHTARSRNDQVATDIKLYLKDQTMLFIDQILSLVKTLSVLAHTHKNTIQPGFTHYQHAMVTTLGHTLAGFAAMLVRDATRLSHWLDLHDTSPLGSVVSYGTTFPIDCAYTADLLGFSAPAINSMDAITNRWEAESDLVFDIVILMNHLSTLAHTLIVWSTPEFGMVQLADEFSTGSSIMPQKKNPDPLEVIKAKAGFAHGQLVSLMSIGKACFIGYNRDTQWSKYIVMDVVDECLPAPFVMKGVLETLLVNKEVMAHWCTKGMIGATTVMEELIQKTHIPMRKAKVMVEKLVKAGSSKLNVDPKTTVSQTKSYGGPGKQALATSLALIANECHDLEMLLVSHKQKMRFAKAKLVKEIGEL